MLLRSNSKKKTSSNKAIDQEIHNKITSIGFEDCKVFIHSVDAQSSANGGIIIQVIGEMSNHGDTWRKFVQTFFLAEQPNGYFVLNDIFRFLKEETLEGDGADDSDIPEPTATVPEPVPAAQTVVSAPEPAYELPREPTPPPAAVEDPVPVAAASAVDDEAPTTDIIEPHVTQTPTPAPEEHTPPPPTATPISQPNGFHTPEPEKQVPVVAVPVEPSPVPTQTLAPRQTTPVPATNPVPTSATVSAPPVTQSQPAAAPVPAPTPAAPQAPRSWASLAASNPKKWGAAVNQESRGTTEILSNPVPANGIPAQVVQSAPAPNSAPQHNPHHQQRGGPHGGGGNQGGHYSALQAAQSVSHAHCFVKGIIEPISQVLLQSTLSTRFGPIKDLEIVRSRACAFIEFSSVDSARKAIVASLPPGQGGEGGIRVDVGGEVGQVRISVETKKDKADRQPGRGRGGGPGGPPGTGAGNGGPENRGGGGGGSFRGRGNAGRGGRSGGGGGASGPK